MGNGNWPFLGTAGLLLLKDKLYDFICDYSKFPKCCHYKHAGELNYEQSSWARLKFVPVIDRLNEYK